MIPSLMSRLWSWQRLAPWGERGVAEPAYDKLSIMATPPTMAHGRHVHRGGKAPGLPLPCRHTLGFSYYSTAYLLSTHSGIGVATPLPTKRVDRETLTTPPSTTTQHHDYHILAPEVAGQDPQCAFTQAVATVMMPTVLVCWSVAGTDGGDRQAGTLAALQRVAKVLSGCVGCIQERETTKSPQTHLQCEQRCGMR